MRATDPAGAVERWPTYESHATALPGGMTPELPKQMPPPPGRDARDAMMESVKTIEPEWVVLDQNSPSGQASIPVAPVAISNEVETVEQVAEKQPLLPALPGDAERNRWRMIITWLTVGSMVISFAVLLVSWPRRAHHHSVATPYIRPGEGCHNMWVWLATLLLLDAVHLLVHQLMRVLKKEEMSIDPNDDLPGTYHAEVRLFHGVFDIFDIVVLGARVLTSWYGVFLVIGIVGFLLVALMVMLCGALVAASSVFMTSAAKNQQVGLGAGAIVLLAFTALGVSIIVDQTSGYPCNDLLHFWAMTLASVYAIALFLALVALLIVARQYPVLRQLRKPSRMASAGSVGSGPVGYGVF